MFGTMKAAAVSVPSVTRTQRKFAAPCCTAVATWDGNGDVSVWCNTQLPFDMKNMLAEVLDLPASKVRVIVPGIGGGFAKLGITEMLYIGECIGLMLIWGGFTFNTWAPRSGPTLAAA